MRFFTRKKTNEASEPKNPIINFKKLLLWGLLWLVVIGFLTALVWKGIAINQRVIRSWEEIKFAFYKPELVKVLREGYTSKQQALDKAFMQKHETAEQKLIQEVVDQLQEGQSKK